MNPRRTHKGVTTALAKPKRIVYRYNDDANSDEEEFDQFGAFAVPERNAIIIRHGRVWKALRVTKDTDSSSQTPIVRIYLTDQNLY